MGKGRKRKNGPRTRSGQLSRAGFSPFDRGTERVEAMQAMYGPDGADAIGRAYRTGLLGVGNEAKAKLDMARRVSNAYWRHYSAGSYKCALGDRTSGSVTEIDQARAKQSEEWLDDQLRTVTALGEGERKAFYQLVIDINPDSGPMWLDRVCHARRNNCDPLDHDALCMSNALAGLDALIA